MCYTIKIDSTREELEKRFHASMDRPEDFKAGNRVSAFSLPNLPVICCDQPEIIALFTWGLIPYWAKDMDIATGIRMKTFNARAESITEKPSFKNSFRNRRCIVLTNGFYEWQTQGNIKLPYFIGLKDHRAFALAGLFDKWTNLSTGEVFNTFSVITTRANPMMEEVHNLKKRMPVILSPEAEQLWLDLRVDPIKTGLFEPYPQELMFAERI